MLRCMRSAALQNNASVDSFLTVVETETEIALREHPAFECVEDFDVFSPTKRGEHEPTTHPS